MAGSRNGFPIAAFTLLLGFAIIQTCEGITTPMPFRKFQVQIQNELSLRPLNVHCKSKDNDLGVHVLQPGQTYDFGFKLNYFTTTLFFCDLSWEFGHKSFDVFKADNKLVYDWCGGKTCQYKASEYGVSMFHSKTGSWDFKYTWDKK